LLSLVAQAFADTNLGKNKGGKWSKLSYHLLSIRQFLFDLLPA
jgi:hypothetical protein